MHCNRKSILRWAYEHMGPVILFITFGFWEATERSGVFSYSLHPKLLWESNKVICIGILLKCCIMESILLFLVFFIFKF